MSSEVQHDWEGSYKKGAESLPWDSGEVAPELVRYLESTSVPSHILEIGCGTGTNSIWMAKKGANVLATEISETAIKIAKEKVAAGSPLTLEFKIADITRESPAMAGSIDFAFDRGVYHVMANEDARQKFLENLAQSMKDGGMWLCIAGSADEMREEGEGGPPQLKASELVVGAEKFFEVVQLKQILSSGPFGKRIIMWEALYRKRPQV